MDHPGSEHSEAPQPPLLCRGTCITGRSTRGIQIHEISYNPANSSPQSQTSERRGKAKAQKALEAGRRAGAVFGGAISVAAAC